jgi:hypothetical protein
MKKKIKPNQRSKTKSSAQASDQKQAKLTAVKFRPKSGNQTPRRAEYMSYAHSEPIPTVESVALVAATLLGKKLSAPGEAVCRAIELMEIAAWIINDIKREHQEEWDGSDPAEQDRLRAKDHYNFSEGAKKITGQTRAGRARLYLERFWKTTISSKIKVRQKINRHMESGFNGLELDGETFFYRQALQQRSKKRSSKKMI